MENLNTIESYMISQTDRIERKKRISFIGIFLFILGLVFLYFSCTDAVENDNDMLKMILLSVGGFLSIYGIVKLLLKKYVYFDKQSKSVLKKYDLYFDNAEGDRLLRLYKNHNFEEIGNLKKDSDSGIVLVFYGTEIGNLFYSVLMKYVQYQYEPIIEVSTHTLSSEVSEITKLIYKYKNKELC